jgi:integrase
MLLSFQGAYFLRKSAALASATLTARKRRAQLAQLRSPGSVLGLTPWHVSQLLAGKRAHPHSARSFLKALRGMIAVAIVAGLCESDPAAGIRVKVPASRGYTTWTEDDISRFETAYPIGTKARLVLALLLYTGQRRGDVIRMGRQHVKGGFLTVRQGKTGATVARQIRLPRFQAMPRFGKLAGTRKRPIRNAWPRPRWRSFSEHQMANLYSLKWLPFRKSLKRKDSKVTMLVCSGPAHQALRPRHPRRAKDRPCGRRFFR